MRLHSLKSMKHNRFNYKIFGELGFGPRIYIKKLARQVCVFSNLGLDFLSSFTLGTLSWCRMVVLGAGLLCASLDDACDARRVVIVELVVQRRLLVPVMDLSSRTCLHFIPSILLYYMDHSNERTGLDWRFGVAPISRQTTRA